MVDIKFMAKVKTMVHISIDMDVFLDMTGTITDMESENMAFLKMCESIGKRFNIQMDGKKIMERILRYRKPFMDNRHKEYYPIRNLIAKAVEEIVPKRLCSSDVFWIIDSYSYYHARYVKLAPGALEALKEIRNISEHMGLITDADTPYTNKVLEALGIKHFFDSITTAEDAGVGKPNPKIFKKALEYSKSNPKVYIGDSEFRDVKGAKGVGMIAIKIGNNSTEADYTVPSLKDAIKILKTLIP